MAVGGWPVMGWKGLKTSLLSRHIFYISIMDGLIDTALLFLHYRALDFCTRSEASWMLGSFLII
jgi:hypothetical protein